MVTVLYPNSQTAKVGVFIKYYKNEAKFNSLMQVYFVKHIDNLLVTNIIEVRKKLRKSTFCAFIDFKKAYDTINRDRMWTKLDNIGMSGKFCTAVRSLYTNVLCSLY